jgi:hypothetical protein
LFKEPVAPVGNADVVKCGELQCVEVGLDNLGVGEGCSGGEWDPGEEVCFGDNKGVAGAEHLRILAGFVITFRDAEEDNTEMFAEVMGCWADEVADIFDEEDVGVCRGEFGKSVVYECDVEVTSAACGDLLHGNERSKSIGIAFGCEVTDEDSDVVPAIPVFGSGLEKAGLAGPWGGDEVDNEGTGGGAGLAKLVRLLFFFG